MERGKIQEFSASSASPSRKFAQDSERRNFFQKKRTGPQPERTFLGAARTCDFPAPSEVHARQLCAISEHLDVACVKLD